MSLGNSDEMVPGENNQIVSIQGMCATASDDASVRWALCIVRDMSNVEYDSKKVAINLPASSTAEQLMKGVSCKFQYDPSTFELVFQKLQEKGEFLEVSIHEHTSETLEELGFQCGDSCRNNLIIVSKGGERPKKDKIVLLFGTPSQENKYWSKMSFADGGDALSSCTYVPPPAPPPYTSGSSEFSYNYSYSQSASRQETGFVGLVNQAMTCYLNSLLQTLFMTPEFRNTLYRWEFDGTEEEGTKSIPFQLQKLFLQLQTSKKPAVGTTELTTSFGWDSSEAWQQHDVQELCRVMFDALEQKFKNTQQADLISRLYEGKLKDYVKCLECSYESAREDTFLDVPLVVRPFGSSQAYASVEEALHAFVTPETLDTNNQYFCEHCNKKCDAHKGLKFTKFPYLLTLQLKRFDFDYGTMHRIKLNDRVSFPDVLNLNEFVKTETCTDGCDDGDTTDSGSALDDDSVGFATGHKTGSSLSPEAITDNIDLGDDDEGIDVGPQGSPLENCSELPVSDRNPRKSQEKGPYMYELFSIMVHSGSANGGHYYAYIKSFKDGEWYCFNDAQVTRITLDDIQKTYGGGPSRGYYSNAYSSSTNAYMLMYRQLDKEKNAEFMDLDTFPEHIKVLLQCMQAQEERERQQREIDRSMCKIKLFCQHPVHHRMSEMKLKVHKEDSLSMATAVAHKIMGLEGVVPLECCRLIKYDDFYDSYVSSFDMNYDEPMGELLGGVKSSYKFDLLLEIRKPTEEFQVYKPGGTTIKIHFVDLQREEVAVQPVTIRCNPSDTVEELRQHIAKSQNISTEKMRIVLETYNYETKLLDVPFQTLDDGAYSKSNKVFVEYNDAADFETPYESSKLFKVLDRYAHTILIHVALPKMDKGMLERLRAKDDDEGKEDSSSEEEQESEVADCMYKKSHRPSEFKLKIKSEIDRWELDKEYLSKKENWEPQFQSGKSKINWESQCKDPDCDEGLGDSEIGDSASTSFGYQNGQALHSDQSEDSSLTDSERTLIGDELSPRNNSPDIMGNEIEPDLEPLHQSGGLEVSKPECDSLLTSSDSSSYLLQGTQDDSRNMSSPEENTKESKSDTHTVAKDEFTEPNETPVVEEKVKHYFRAWPYTDCETGEKMLRVYVDKRTTLMDVKKELEPHIGVGSDCFKIFRVYSNDQEAECTRLSDNLMTYGDDCKLTIKLGRALRKGEHKVQFYQLCVNDPEPIKYLIEWVILKNMTVLKVKKEILPEIKEKCGIDIPLNRCRMREKHWKNPGLIFWDERKFEKDIFLKNNSEIFLEVLQDAEPVPDCFHTTLYVRRWYPSKFKLSPMEEIFMRHIDAASLVKQLSEKSDIPEEHIEFAKGRGSFPCESSLLTLHKDLEWRAQQDSQNQSLGVDGEVFYYRDMREELKKLTDEEKREISNKENARSNKSHKTTFSHKKEKALKIYTLDTPSSSSSTTQNSSDKYFR